MMTDLETKLPLILKESNGPVESIPARINGFDVPKEYARLLKIADGFVTHDRFFRVFGTRSSKIDPGVEEWNASQWKKDYNCGLDNTVFIADDIFGNQYGYRYFENNEFIKFYCETGEIEPIQSGINWFLQALFLPFEVGRLDEELIQASRDFGMMPEANQHLAFRLPLVVGGEYSYNNLTLESAPLHLGLLAQLCSTNRSFTDNTRIKRFRETE